MQTKPMTGDQPAASTEQHPNQTGLPDQLKAEIEHLSGFSLDNVKVHYNSDKPTQLNALAYAQGTDIHVAPGEERDRVVQVRDGQIIEVVDNRTAIAEQVVKHADDHRREGIKIPLGMKSQLVMG